MMELLEHLGPLLGVIVVIGGFLFWHFRTVNAFKDEINDLKRKCDSLASKDELRQLELKQKDLERHDALQQQTIDLLPQLLPMIRDAMKQLGPNK